jgi:hypothetical protein
VLPKEIRSRVAFMEGDPEAPNAEFNVGDILRLLALFNPKLYPPESKDPVTAYTSEKNLIVFWKKGDYEHLLPHVVKFIELHDEVAGLFVKEMDSPGKVKGVIAYTRKGDSPLVLLSGKTSRHFIPPPFTFPVLAAMRVFLATDGSKWTVHPETLIKDPRFAKALVASAWALYKKEGRSRAAFFGRNRQVLAA